MTEDSDHVTVVFAGQSESWAKWVEEECETAGIRTHLVRWDPLRKPPEGRALTDLLAAPGRVLLVLDDWYLRFDAGRYRAWADVLRQVLPAHRSQIAAVSVTPHSLPEAARELNPAGLFGIGREEAKQRLLTACGLVLDKHTGVDLDRGLRFPDEPPPVSNVERRNRRFTGRRRTLEQVHRLLTDRTPASPATSALVAVHGAGGMGKTELAREYAHRYAGEYDVIWWVRAHTPLMAREDFAALAKELRTGDGDELRGLITAAQERLASSRKRWLLVFDGAESPDGLADLLPRGPGHVLITTRDTSWPAHGAELVSLPRFDREESVAFACRRAPRITEEDADRLADVVEDLPILIDQMAAWLEAYPLTDVARYVEDIRDGDPNALDVMPSGGEAQRFQAVWSTTLNALGEDAPHAHELLKLLAHFSADTVPVRLLRSARASDLPTHLARLVSEPSNWNSALRTLSETTSMRLEYETGPQDDILTVGTLRMHRLFHRFVRSTLSVHDRRRASETACRVLVAADPRDPTAPRHWQRYADLIPHLEPSGALASADEDVRSLVLNCVEYLRMRGEYADGWMITRKALDQWRIDSGPTDRTILVATHQYANMLRRLGRYADAEGVGRDILDRLSADPEARAIELMRAMNGLGGTLVALGRYDEARTLYESAVTRAVEELGDRNVPRTLAIRSNLAQAVALQGRYAESLAQHRSILEARVGLLGPRNALTLMSALHTAWTLRLLGRYREALVIQERNTWLHSQVLDRDHSQTLQAQHNLALCRRREGDLEYAHAMMRRVREKMTGRRGGHHPETLLISADYAMLLREMGRYDEALGIAESTARVYAAQLGDDHPYAIGSRANCGVVLRCLGHRADALAIGEETTAGMARALGDAHPWSIGCALNTTAARAATDDPLGAVDLGRAALERASAGLGDGHAMTVALRAGLALDLRAAGKEDEAEALADEAPDRDGDAAGGERRRRRSTVAAGRPYWDFEPQPV